MAAVTSRPECFIGMHFFNPVPVMKLVEVIRGIATSDETVAIIKDLSKKMGKTAIEVKEAPGFVVNRPRAHDHGSHIRVAGRFGD